MQTESKSHFKGIILLILVNLIGATTFPLTKEIVTSLSPSTLIAVRFIVASAFFAAYLRNLNLRLVRDGVAIGFLLFLYLAIETVALGTIPANRAVFIASLSTLIVPLLGLLSGQRVTSKTFIASALAVLGIGAMFWEGGELGIGDLLMFVDAVVYAVYILYLEQVASRHATLPLTGVQLLFIGGLGTVWSNSQLLTQFDAIEQHWQPIVYLAVIATAVAIWLQTLAQRWVSGAESALLYTLEPLFSVIFSYWLLGEKLGTRGIFGAVLVLAALILSQIPEAEDKSVTGNEPDSEIGEDNKVLVKIGKD
jgi:drug/metabolite transporter (DMT)-like permease